MTSRPPRDLTKVDSSVAPQLFARRDAVLNGPWHFWSFREEFLKRRRLTAVPFQNSLYFRRESVKVANVCRAQGFQRAHAISFDDPNCCYEANLTADDWWPWTTSILFGRTSCCLRSRRDLPS